MQTFPGYGVGSLLPSGSTRALLNEKGGDGLPLSEPTMDLKGEDRSVVMHTVDQDTQTFVNYRGELQSRTVSTIGCTQYRSVIQTFVHCIYTFFNYRARCSQLRSTVQTQCTLTFVSYRGSSQPLSVSTIPSNEDRSLAIE